MGLQMGDRMQVYHGQHVVCVGIIIAKSRGRKYPVFKEPRPMRHRIAFVDGNIGWARKAYVVRWHPSWPEVTALLDEFLNNYPTRFQRAEFRRRLASMGGADAIR